MTNHDVAKSLLVCAEFNPARCVDCVVADLRHNRGCFKRLAHMASDRLEALTEHKNGWVPVTEQLPVESGTYLVNVHQEDDCKACDCVLEAWYWADKPLFCPDSVGWHMLNEFYPYSDTMRDSITHWMPWPEPPEVEA